MNSLILAVAAPANNDVTAFQGGPLTFEYVVPIFLIMIFAAALFSSKTKIPHTMILLGFGVCISSIISLKGLGIPNFSQFSINPNLVITFIIPPLIFEAMMNVDYKRFKAIRISALLFATIGVILATLIAGFLLVYIAGLPILPAFAFAALISPTDAAIVIEIFKSVRVPRVLSTLMESEAAFNDATGAIAFSSIIALAVGSSGYVIAGTYNSGSFLTSSFPSISNSFINLSFIIHVEHFIVLFFGGSAIGLGIAAATHRLHTLMNDPLSETSLTIATVFGSVVLANTLGVSGLAAVAVAGLYFGNVTVKKEAIMSKNVRTFAFNFWEMIAFLASSAAFIYLGISMNLIDIVQHFPIIALSLIAVFGARAATIYPLLAATTRFTRENIPNVWKHIVLIGGMRGAISVALVASLPPSNLKNILQTITFGVVLLSLIIQYVVLSRYVKRVFPDVK